MKVVRKESMKQFVLIYGASGVGKTHLAATLGELGKVLLVDVDEGSATLMFDAHALKKSALDNITVVSYDSFKDLDTLYQLCKANDPAKWNQTFGEDVCDQPYDWIVIDTWSALLSYMQAELRAKNIGFGSASTLPVTSSKLEFRKSLELQHWGQLTTLNQYAVEAFRALDVNVCVLCQEALIRDELTGSVNGGPALFGKLIQEFPAYFQTVIYMYIESGSKERVATTVPEKRFVAKARMKKPASHKNPTMSLFI